jgi:asparagine synthase (glutamine-hydrolysing)
MCGIAGFIDPSLSAIEARDRLGAMLERIVHRGPDGEGTHVETPLAMGMRRLSIIDLEGGSQPIWNEDRSVGVVFNGEIYNYRELRGALAGHQFRTQSDTEVLVHLYEERGVELCSALRGMFAFAIFDRPRRRLFFARDHFGQKPLYYYAAPRMFAFGSELKSLFALPEVPSDLDPEAFLDFVSWLSVPPPGTHFSGIKKLCAGHRMVVELEDPASPKIERYWALEFDPAHAFYKEDAAVDALDGALKESAALHLRADVPVGVLLSSGLDSRCVASYAKEAAGGRLSTFSVGFADGDSEMEGAARTAAEIGSEHHAIELSAGSFSDSLEKIAWLLDEPVGDPAAFAVLRVCEMARNHVKVLLSGEGADELFAGYAERYQGILRTLSRSRGWRWAARFAPEPAVPQPGIPTTRWDRFLDRAHRTAGAEVAALRREGLPGDVREPRGLTSAQIVRASRRAEEVAKRFWSDQAGDLEGVLRFDAEWQLAESLLQKADKMSMGASIELRAPFLDTGVAAVAMRVPKWLKLRMDGSGKYVLRKCLARRLPEKLDRPKRGFPVPLRSWFFGPLRPRIEEELFSRGAWWSGVLDRQLVYRAWEDAGDGLWDGTRFFFSLWLHEIWRKQVVERRAAGGGNP